MPNGLGVLSTRQERASHFGVPGARKRPTAEASLPAEEEQSEGHAIHPDPPAGPPQRQMWPGQLCGDTSSHICLQGQDLKCL